MANPSNNSVFTQFTLDLQSSTQAVPGIVANQVLIGNVEFVACQNFYEDVANNGYYFVIEPPSGEASFFNYNGMFECTGFLFYPIPADLSYNWITVNDMIGTLIAGWAHWTNPSQSQWVKGQNRSAVKMKWDKPEIRYKPKPCGKFLETQSFIVSTRFVFTMPFIADQAANVILNPEA